MPVAAYKFGHLCVWTFSSLIEGLGAYTSYKLASGLPASKCGDARYAVAVQDKVASGCCAYVNGAGELYIETKGCDLTSGAWCFASGAYIC